MKIAILSFYSGTRLRGLETFIEDLSVRLRKNFKIQIFQLSGTGSISFDRSVPKILRKLYLDYYSIKILIFTIRVLKRLVRDKPDVIMPTNNGWQSILCKLYSSVFKIPMILVGQAGPGWDDLVNLKLKPDRFITFSESQTEWARKNSSGVKIVNLPQGVNLKIFKKGVKPAPLNLPRPIIICVSALDSYKRVNLVLQAVSRLKNASLLLVCYGSSRQIELINSLGKKILGNRFLQTNVSYPQMPNYYCAADLFTLVSDSREAFGRVYLEAMSCNLPVVATDDRLRREIIGKAGLFVKHAENIDEYAGVLREALKRNWGNLPEKQAINYSWEKICPKYQNILESIKND